MKPIYLFFILSFCSTNIFAQQNLFNIPSSDLTPKGKFFFQQQVNSYSYKFYESKSHLVMGVNKWLEAGVNFINLPINFGAKPSLYANSNTTTGSSVYPLLLGTAMAKKKFNEYFQGSIGTQTGANLLIYGEDTRKLVTFNYAILAFEPWHHVRFMGGGYFGNRYLIGGFENQFGYMLGYEIKVYKKWYVMGDFISGQHEQSSTVLGLMYVLSPRVQLCAGKLLNFPNEKKLDGFVFELNILGFDMD